MLKNGIILIFRKFKSHAIAGLVFILGLSVGYAWLVSALFQTDWFGILGALVILFATAGRGYPIMNKKELGLFKILGAHKKNILPFIITQATVVSGIATLVALAVMGMVSNSLFVNIDILHAAHAEWLLPLASATLILVVGIVFFLIFTQSHTSISKT